MPTECNPNRFAFAPAEGRPVVASFDGGAITSDAGALLLGATDRVLGLTRRLAACFKDSRDPAYTEHTVETLVMAPPSNDATTGRPSAGANASRFGLHCVGIGDFLCCAIKALSQKNFRSIRAPMHLTLVRDAG